MQASTAATLTIGDYGTIFIAIELSQKTWLVTLHSPDKDRISRHRLEGGNHAELLALIGRIRERAARALGGVPAVVSCYEAGYDGFWLHRLLLAAGIANYVFDPASIAVDQRARRVKTDRIDGEKMLRTLMAYLRGEPQVVRIVRVPSAEQEDARRASRERDRLIKEQTAHTNRIKALLRLLGMAVGNPRRRKWLSWLATQRDWQGQAVPPQMLSEIRHEHTRLMLVRERLDALAKTPAQADPSPATAQMAERSELLLRLKCLGPAFATTLTHEVFYKDFRNRREVGSYFGLTPCP
jgi:transposase